jgi:peptide/nickel transport system permease protein
MGMGQYIVRRMLHSVFVILGVITAVFIITNLTGDPVRTMFGAFVTDPQELERYRQELGLDRPLYVQYVDFVTSAVVLDFHDSLRLQGGAMENVLYRFPRTLLLASAAMLIAVSLSVVFGIISAVKRYSIFDNIVMFLALLGQSIPNFWLGIMLILLFAVTLGWLPSQGYELSLRYLILPAVTLAAPPLAQMTRLVRSGMLDVMSSDYVRTARAKGLHERTVVFGHAFKNTAIPLVTMIGLNFGLLLAGAIVTEQVFQWNGVGLLLVDSIFARDFPVVQAAVFIIASTFVLINLLVDILYTWLDPRVRLT